MTDTPMVIPEDLKELYDASEERIKNLEQALRELLHWIYPRTGDPDHRCAHFLDEVVIAYQLLNDPSPFEAPPKATQTKEGS